MSAQQHQPHPEGAGESLPRWIMHMDMDAFFASIEQLDNPDLRGKPVIVGGEVRGVVSAASYEARKFGVHSAMPSGQARRLCPQGCFVRGRMERYKEMSMIVQAALHRFSPLVEQASVDEAYLDVTGTERLFGPVESLALAVKAAVREATGGLTCSVGIAPVKFLAKIVSDLRKPDGVFILPHADVAAFLQSLDVGKIPGVGKVFCRELSSLGIRTCGDVLLRPEEFWLRRFGKSGVHLWQRAQGLDAGQVHPEREAKSESAEATFETDTADREYLKNWLFRHAERVGRSLRKHGLKARCVTLKIKYANFKQITRQLSLDEATCATQTLYEHGCTLLDAVELEQPVRLIGLGASHFGEATRQLSLFASPSDEARRTRLDTTLDTLCDRFGKAIIRRAR